MPPDLGHNFGRFWGLRHNFGGKAPKNAADSAMTPAEAPLFAVSRGLVQAELVAISVCYIANYRPRY